MEELERQAGIDGAPAQVGIWLGLLGVVDQVRSLLDEQIQDEAGLTIVQFGILQRLLHARDGQLTLTRIADTISAARSAVTYQVSRLEDASLVDRQTSPRDERATIVRITSSGRERVSTLQPAHDALIDQLLFQHLNSDRAAVIREFLLDVQHQLDELPPRSARRRAALRSKNGPRRAG